MRFMIHGTLHDILVSLYGSFPGRSVLGERVRRSGHSTCYTCKIPKVQFTGDYLRDQLLLQPRICLGNGITSALFEAEGVAQSTVHLIQAGILSRICQTSHTQCNGGHFSADVTGQSCYSKRSQAVSVRNPSPTSVTPCFTTYTVDHIKFAQGVSTIWGFKNGDPPVRW